MSGRRRSKVSQKIYRDRTRQKNQENAAIAEYVAKYYPWVIEAYKNQKEKVIIINSSVFSFLYTVKLQTFSFLARRSKRNSSSHAGKYFGRIY